MPTVITCPSCSRSLRVPDELQGRQVRCPSCSTEFTAGAAAAAPSSGPGLPRLSIDEQPPSAPSPPPGRRLVGAVEMPVSGQPDAPPPPPPPPGPPPPRRDERGWDRRPPPYDDRAEWERRRSGGGRRYQEPHRSGTILGLGITGLVLCVLPPVGLALSIIAWVMGQSDMAKMDRGEMDHSGQEATRGGWICGIIGTGLSGLALLGCCGWWMVVLSWEHHGFDPFD
jgi:predicted Zn finger-like uncharacterized protein